MTAPGDIIPPIPGDDRLTTSPIGRPDIWAIYQRATASFWRPEEIPMSRDKEHFDHKLTEEERRFVKHVLAFFAASDGIVNENLIGCFRAEINILEVRYGYDFQVMMENIHATVYSMQLDTYITDPIEREYLLNAAKNIPVITAMTNYMKKCIASGKTGDAPLGERLLRMACVEGIFFTGCFCAIYWLQNRGLMPGFGQANEFIARDEALHTEMALKLYLLIPNRLPQARITEIFTEAVDIATEFTNDALPKNLKEMNKILMAQYIKYVADNLISMINYQPIFKVENPFGFMEQINLTNRTNFFERRGAEYSRAMAQDTKNTAMVDSIAEDF
jgi:ribonucleotide reductase beta subunit family protein with ferritin-like domain